MSTSTSHIHLDPVGGIAGDMFVGALLELRPDLSDATIEAVRLTGLDQDGLDITHRKYSDGILTGGRFDVKLTRTVNNHRHVHWSTIRKRLLNSGLSRAVCERTIAIFTHLAEAEASVHGKVVEEVEFHEVGAWDSIADIVAAAFLIESLEGFSWSIGPIPVGSGSVSTAHGLLPVPVPATVLLLDGFHCFDDGTPGERVTPTGAAIVRHLNPGYGIGRLPRKLDKTGYGFGTRRFSGMSNVLRALHYKTGNVCVTRSDQVRVICFEVDDQTAEDLAIALDKLRKTKGVIDVTQHPVTGKRGRMLAGIQILAEPGMTEQVVDTCFHETTTLGIRLQLTDRLVLKRSDYRSAEGIGVKVVDRPYGITAKAELKDVENSKGHQGRQSLREKAVSEVINNDR